MSIRDPLPRVLVFLGYLSFLILSGRTIALSQPSESSFKSSPPTRPLPQASNRSIDPQSIGRFVDSEKGDDQNPGTEASPWKTIRHAIGQLHPGETLYLRGGRYYERVNLSLSGEKDLPITIRSYPGELAIVDGGYREFIDAPETAWEPVTDGQPGEFRSTRTYPELSEATSVAPWHDTHPEHPRVRLGGSPSNDSALGVHRGIYGSGYFSAAVKVLGNFADSMVPLHGYYNLADLPQDDPIIEKRPVQYVGPGLWFDMKTERIHIRLMPTELKIAGDVNYRGETDPRKLPLVIGGARVAMHVEKSSHLRLQDFVIRGTRSRTLNIESSHDVELDHLTLYGGAPALHIESSHHLLMHDCAVRGLCAPWCSRSSEKYYGISSYLFIADSTAPQNNDIEIANCEFTDNHDGLIIGTIDRLRFHHNFVDNFNDDGLYLTLDMPSGEDVRIYQNYLSRSLSMLAFSGKGDDQKGEVASIYRNVIDLRTGTLSLDEMQTSRICGDHGSPSWKPIRFYQNTVLAPETPWRDYYAAGLGSHLQGSDRVLLNNIFHHITGTPGFHIEALGDFLADGNLHWSKDVTESTPGEFLTKSRQPIGNLPDWFNESKKSYAPGWTAHDRFGDPQFEHIGPLPGEPLDLRLKAESTAIDAGLPIDENWDDPLRSTDAGKPDLGAIPAGSPAWTVGIDGRFSAAGVPK